jgi:hypothetical protein
LISKYLREIPHCGGRFGAPILFSVERRVASPSSMISTKILALAATLIVGSSALSIDTSTLKQEKDRSSTSTKHPFAKEEGMIGLRNQYVGNDRYMTGMTETETPTKVIN